MLKYKNKILWLLTKPKWFRKRRKVLIAEWDRDLTKNETNAIESGYSPLFFEKGLLRYYHCLDKAFLYGLIPTIKEQ